ncbi:uncharacterized protein DUF58 [Hypnocyclicus thermotrophus]|uniref:Uncharacterized protein DUF58 n=1 Tax=Hypnocyclicus thermotrophus TaxID=1627895 RepID=A0AA46DZR0_9FUSO|nr:DUF58 domain-containing protein [Hypnocyclicus thermotrophus]TDT71844.1 uncharacterized protein DUF58 [Hypnocyclicus thermotrophus]
MASKEILKKIKKIDINSKILSEHLLVGKYHSKFKGKGLEFSNIRKYTPGDDVRNIDWKISKKLQKTYIKEFIEERELSIYFLIDISNSNILQNRREYIAEIAGTIANSAIENGDKIGAYLFTNKIEKILKVNNTKKHLLAIIDAILTFQSENKDTNIKKSIEEFLSLKLKKGIVFLISDFYDENYEKEIKFLLKKHELILIRIFNKSFEALDKNIVYRFIDSETNQEILYKKNSENLNMKLNFNNYIEFEVGENYIPKLIKLFNYRGRK